MKRYLSLLLLLCVLLTACDAPQPEQPEEPTPPASDVGEVPPEEPLPTPPEAEPPEELPAGSALLEQASVLDEQGRVRYVPNPRVESRLQQEIALYGDSLLLWGFGEGGFCLTRLSLQTGEMLQERYFEQVELPSVQVCGEQIAVADWETGKVTLLDGAFSILRELETQTAFCPIYLDKEATRVYCFTQEGVRVLNVENGSETVLFDNAVMLFASSRCGSTVSVAYTDRQTQMSKDGIVDLDRGVAETVPYEGAFSSTEANGDVWLASMMAEEERYWLGRGDRPKTFVPNGETALMSLIPDPLRLLATGWDEKGCTVMTLYSLEGRFLSSCTLPERVAQVLYEPVWSEADGGYFFTAIDGEGRDLLLFWDLSVPSAGVDLTLEAVRSEETTLSAVPEALLDRAAALGNAYGVEILLGDRTEAEYGIYSMAREMDEDYITAGLDGVEAALKKYPAGFFSQLLYGEQRRLEIHLTGAFSLKTLPEGEVNGFTTYIGLAEEQAGKTVIVVDITMAGSIEQTVHHEIMHVIDNKLAFDAKIREEALYSEEDWNALNPEGFSYVEDKFHLPENIYWDGYDRWFVDVYSRTTAKEDRARILEYAMVEADWAFSGAEGRYQKLKYLCACIDDAFRTADWPEVTFWEAVLARCG